MKNKVVTAAVAAVMCAGIFFSACENPGKSILLGEPAAPAEFSYEESRDEGFEALNKSAQKFAAEFAAAACNLDASGKNFAVSPVSMYSALALAAECSSGDTRAEILSAMNTDYAALSENYSDIPHRRPGQGQPGGLPSRRRVRKGRQSAPPGENQDFQIQRQRA